ncbi:hypothetical protein Tco_1194164, partial [Tanacetum coccineum]
RSRVASRPSLPSRSSSPTTSTSEIPTAPIPPAPPTIVAPSADIISPIDAPPRGFDRKEVADHSPADHTSGHSTSDQSLSRHFSLSLPLGMRPRLWLRSPMSSIRFLSTVESSPSDSSATTSDRHSHLPSHSARPSRKRCRSPATTVPSSILASRALFPTRVDLLPPRKRFRYSYSSEDSVEEDIDVDVLTDIEADDAAIEVASDMNVEDEVDASIGIEVGCDIEDKDGGETESSNRGTMEVGVDVVARIDIPDGQRQLEANSLIASGERVGLLDHVAALERSNARLRDTLRMESVRADRLWGRMGFMASELRHICRFRYYDKLRFRILEAFAARRLGFRP